jgi:uncharacterized protein (TIGR03437 family)
VIDGTTVSFDVPSAGISVPGYLTFVGPGQINVQVPWELAGQSSVQMKVSVDDGYLLGNVVTVPLAQYTPSFFVGRHHRRPGCHHGRPDSGGQPGPCRRDSGAVCQWAGTGDERAGERRSGAWRRQPGQHDHAAGGDDRRAAGPSRFSGLAPGFPGLYQINATVPSGLTGNQNVTVSIGGQTSPVVVAGPVAGAPGDRRKRLSPGLPDILVVLDMANPKYAVSDKPAPVAELVDTLSDGTKVKRRIPRMRACSEKDAKGKLCAGHLKRWYFFGEEVKRKFGAEAEIYRCEHCQTLYLPNAEEKPQGRGR